MSRPAHGHREGQRCSAQCPSMESRLSPRAMRWVLGTAIMLVAVFLMVMPMSWVLRIVRATFTLGLLACVVALVVAFCNVLLAAAVGHREHR